MFELTVFELTMFELTMFELTVFELTMHFKHKMIGKHFIETSNIVELRINRVRINRAQPVLYSAVFFSMYIQIKMPIFCVACHEFIY